MKKNIDKSLFQKDKFNLVFIAVSAAVTILPVLFFGIPDGYDLPHHYQCAATFLDAVKSGDFYPSWSLDRNLGYGGLELRMYPPLSHYVLALFKLATGNWHLATWLTYTFWWIVGCFGIYFWTKEFTKSENAVFAAILFGIIPYRINEIYQTFLYAEFAAGSILPFCFLFLTRITKDSCEKEENANLKKTFISTNILGFAVSLSALILTHLPLTLIGIIALVIYFLCQVKWRFPDFSYIFARVSFGGLLALASTSFFWVKVLQERFMMAKTSIHEELEVHYQFNFLLTPIQIYDEITYKLSFVPFFYDLVLLLTILIVLPMAITGLLKNPSLEKRQWLGLWIVFIFSIFITTVLSRPLWDNLPLLFEVQFPWRWLNIVSIFAPVLAAGGFSTCLKWYENEEFRKYAVMVSGVFIIALTLSISWAISTAAYIPPKDTDYRIEQAIKGKSFKFWGTIWAREDFVNNLTNKVSVNLRQTNVLEWKPTERIFTVEEGQPSDAYVATFYHPNWHTTVNNIPTEIRPTSDGGMIISVPFQNSVIKLSFQESPAVSSAQLLSKTVWLLLLSYGAFWCIKKYQITKK